MIRWRRDGKLAEDPGKGRASEKEGMPYLLLGRLRRTAIIAFCLRFHDRLGRHLRFISSPGGQT